METLSNMFLDDLKLKELSLKLQGRDLTILVKDTDYPLEKIKGKFENILNLSGNLVLFLNDGESSAFSFTGLFRGIERIYNSNPDKIFYGNLSVADEYFDINKKDNEERKRIFNQGVWYLQNLD